MTVRPSPPNSTKGPSHSEYPNVVRPAKITVRTVDAIRLRSNVFPPATAIDDSVMLEHALAFCEDPEPTSS